MVRNIGTEAVSRAVETGNAFLTKATLKVTPRQHPGHGERTLMWFVLPGAHPQPDQMLFLSSGWHNHGSASRCRPVPADMVPARWGCPRWPA